MEQNINLLKAINIQAPSRFSALLILEVIGGWIGFLLLIYMISYVVYLQKQRTLDRLEVTKKTLQVQIEELNKQMTYLGGAVSTAAEKKKGEIPIASIRITSFYRYLEDLARYTPSNIWLDTIILSQPEDLIQLSGKATSAADVPDFIDALDTADYFNNKKFNTLQLEKVPNSGYISFTLSSTVVKEEARQNL